jgi:hypothetical protein
MRMPFALLHIPSKLLPLPEPGYAGSVWPLPCDLKDVAETVGMETAHGVELDREYVSVSRFQLLDEALDLGGMISFAVCGFCCGDLGFWMDGWTRSVVAALFMAFRLLGCRLRWCSESGLDDSGSAKRRGASVPSYSVRFHLALLVAERESVFVSEQHGFCHLFKAAVLLLQQVVEGDA